MHYDRVGITVKQSNLLARTLIAEIFLISLLSYGHSPRQTINYARIQRLIMHLIKTEL